MNDQGEIIFSVEHYENGSSESQTMEGCLSDSSTSEESKPYEDSPGYVPRKWQLSLHSNEQDAAKAAKTHFDQILSEMKNLAEARKKAKSTE